jgi:hypothetical protein
VIHGFANPLALCLRNHAQSPAEASLSVQDEVGGKNSQEDKICYRGEEGPQTGKNITCHRAHMLPKILWIQEIGDRPAHHWRLP